MSAAIKARNQVLLAQIEAQATELCLPTVRSQFHKLADDAVREGQTHLAYLTALFEAEIEQRALRRTARRLKEARFPAHKTLPEFCFADNPGVPKTQLAALSECRWIGEKESVVLVGDSGTGKTHLATALGVCACELGLSVRFTTLAQLANELIEAQSEQKLARLLARYRRLGLLIIDELGFLTLPDGAAELVFQVISERNELGSLIITTNLPFGEWTKVFPDPRLAGAVVDRVTHRSHIIETGSKSWRFQQGMGRRAQAKKAKGVAVS